MEVDLADEGLSGWPVECPQVRAGQDPGLELGTLRIPTDNVTLLTECDWELTLPSLSLTAPPRRSWYRSL